MQFYLAALDGLVCMPDENPPIGIINTRGLLLPRLASGELDVSELEIAGAPEGVESEVRR